VVLSVKPAAPGTRASATLSVTDTGPGIDPVDLPFVFDRFYRSHEVRGTQGMGLGLTVARGLAEAQGGTIDVANGLDGGAVFTVFVPPAG
jgi:signal transduction histidine kinase